MTTDRKKSKQRQRPSAAEDPTPPGAPRGLVVPLPARPKKVGRLDKPESARRELARLYREARTGRLPWEHATRGGQLLHLLANRLDAERAAAKEGDGEGAMADFYREREQAVDALARSAVGLCPPCRARVVEAIDKLAGQD